MIVSLVLIIFSHTIVSLIITGIESSVVILMVSICTESSHLYPFLIALLRWYCAEQDHKKNTNKKKKKKKKKMHFYI